MTRVLDIEGDCECECIVLLIDRMRRVLQTVYSPLESGVKYFVHLTHVGAVSFLLLD